jgi:glutamate-1-semialdehyde 2,1-aminomutase
LCKKNGIVFILDEMITGFRWGTGGAQKNFQVTPDLSTFGKAMANGYPLACLVGKREIMSQGSINNLGSERLFLISTTHGADMASLGAFVANVELITKKPVLENIWKSGFDLMQLMKKKAAEAGLSEYFDVVGPACSPRYVTYDGTKSNSLEFRTLFIQEMLKHEILMPWISIAYRHKDIDFSQLEFALSSTFNVYSKALETDPRKFVQGDFIKPVFRKFN